MRKPGLRMGVMLFFSVSIGIILSPVTSFAESEINEFNWTKSKKFYSSYLEAEILYLPDVFPPKEAEDYVLPFMKDHSWFFEGKTVLDIGTGSGIISLYAAKLGAKKIIATDINKNALTSTRLNAQRLKLSSVIETRYLPPSDISAYSVIKSNETFDVIISNPPYSLDLDATENTAITDKGDLGFSIIRELEKHLKPDGVAMLLYRSYFYHHVMVKFARYLEYKVRNYNSDWLTPWEEDVIFNSYLRRLLEYENIDPDAFRFNWRKDKRLEEFKVLREKQSFEENDSQKQYPGFIIIKKITSENKK